jgi:hypothetical protein
MRLLMLSVLVTGLLLIPGCGGGPDFVEIKGKVLLDGKPLNEGEVSFIPDNSKGTSGPMAMGTVNENGEFTLTTGTNEGVLVGHHKVTVKCPYRPGEGSSATGDSSAGEKKGPCPIPPKYFEATTSGLTQEIKSDDEEIIIELKR